ncbi:MAG TPA: phenylacetate--CoA ligase family protein [Candidatus Hypogeohydataceae bacterium YC41]
MRPYDVLDLYELMKNQWRKPEELAEIQVKKLQKLVRHAYEEVPYYRRLFDSVKLTPSDIKDISDLTKIPITSKEQLVSLPLKEITAGGVDLDYCRVTTTSGTTGVPIKTYYRRRDFTLMNLGWARAYLAHGMKPWYRIGAFSGWPSISPKPSWYEYIGLWRRKVLSSLDSPDIWISELRKWRPQVITGYVMNLKLLAFAIQEHGDSDIRPQLIFSTSAILDDYSRKFITDVFKEKVVDIYGSNEGGCIAWECPQCNGYHVNIDMLVLEILENGKSVPPGKEGEVVITNLHSYAMPLIRYRLGDIGTLSPEVPSCGRGMPLLKEITGRIDDFIVLPSGKRISPHPFYHALRWVRGIAKWRIIQEENGILKVEVVVSKDFSYNGSSLIEANLRKIFDDKLKIEISIVAEIKQDPSQKFRSVISKVKKADLI